MEFETWWLLALPLFFALGWLAARIDIKQLVTESRRLPNSYFKGLNFLLNEQPDKAIEAFIEVAKVERGIRMHQNLLDREDLAPEQRMAALFELAQDYLKAGLLDRAEELFSKLVGTAYEQQGLKFLLEIYEQEKDWMKAIETSRKMDAITGESSAKDIAHFYCELAAAEIPHSRFDNARRFLDEALGVNRKCTRANMLLGDIAMVEGDTAGAIAIWQRIETQNPAYLSLLADKLIAAYDKAGRHGEGLHLLRGYLEANPSLDLLMAVFQATLESEGPDAAHQLLREQLRRMPTLIGLAKLVDVQIVQAPPERQPDLELVRNLLQQHTRNLALYKCDSCGFRARQFYWHCPACHGWETYVPRRTEERELAA
jgi:lipopolysaccharide biosynthesis regulator YciM